MSRGNKMPIKVPNDLPAVETLTNENVFVMTDTRAMTQDIRPLQILIRNLMPTKIDTETQLTRLLGNTPLQVELDLLQTSTHKSHVTAEEHMLAFYKTFDDVKGNFYDGMIITGAPVEQMEFEEVELGRALRDHGMDKDSRPFDVPYLLGCAGGSVLSLRHKEISAA